MCTEEEREKCLIEVAEENLEWTCTNCKKQKADVISPWTYHLLQIRKLQKAGYPFDKNELTIEEWQDLGTVNEKIESIEQEIMFKRRLF